MNALPKLTGLGLLTLCEAMHRVAELPQRIPTLAVSFRLQQEAALRDQLVGIQHLLPSAEFHSWLLAGFSHDLKIVAERATQVPIGPSKEFDGFCRAISEALKVRHDEDQRLIAALEVLLDAMRHRELVWARREDRRRGAPMRAGRPSNLMQPLRIDLDRRHLVPSVRGALYADRCHAIRHDWICYDVMVDRRTFVSQLPKLSKALKAGSGPLGPHRPPLKFSSVLVDWFDCFLFPFKRSGLLPTEVQLTLALSIAFPMHSDHRGAGRALIAALAKRPDGRPRTR